MKLIVGLGNPGSRYRGTPHNVGYEVVDILARRAGLSWRRSRLIDAEFADGILNGLDCMLLKPLTYMNESGRAIAPLVRGEKMDPATDLLVAVDDAALPLGRLRIRQAGSSGGHKGLESIIRDLGAGQFSRLRCGIAPEETDRIEDMREYVLSSWPRSLRIKVDEMVERAADAVTDWMRSDIQSVMSRYNQKMEDVDS